MTQLNVTSDPEKCDTEKENEKIPQRKRNVSIWSCDFESAIAATGFGKFNIFLTIVSFFTGLIAVFEPRAMPYIISTAECDLQLEIEQKAMLNSMSFAGMALTYPILGFIGDKRGRKKLIIMICFLDFVCWVIAASAQTYEVLLVARFFGGAVSSGIYPCLASYLTEIHGVKHRAIMQLFLGNIFGFGDLLLPIMSLTILPNIQTFSFLSLVIHPWNTYLLVCAIPALISGFGFLLLPESPKFLMSKRQNDDAIEVFKTIYTINTNYGTREEYPVKSLKKESNDSTEITKTGCISHMAMFLEKRYLKNILLSMFAQCFIFMGLNSILLWSPQIFQQMENHQNRHNGSASVCDTLSDLLSETPKKIIECKQESAFSFKSDICCMAVASATILLFAISGSVINRLGKRKLLYILGILSAISATLLVFAHDFIMTLILIACICAFGNIGFNILVAIVVDIFPTNSRAMSVSLIMMMGRIGGAVSSFIFPVFLLYGCLPAFLFIAYINIVWVVLVYLLPNTENLDISNKSDD